MFMFGMYGCFGNQVIIIDINEFFFSQSTAKKNKHFHILHNYNIDDFFSGSEIKLLVKTMKEQKKLIV